MLYSHTNDDNAADTAHQFLDVYVLNTLYFEDYIGWDEVVDCFVIKLLY